MSTQHDNVTTEGGPPDDGGAPVDRETEHERDGTREDADLSLDTVFEIIRNERRRLVLEYLRGTEKQTTLSDLAEHIAAIENDTTVEDLSAQQRKRVYVGLYQCHLPKMADAGVVEFDKDRGIVTAGPTVDQVAPYLDVDAEGEDGSLDERWYPVLAGTAVAGYLLAAFGGGVGELAGGAVVFGTLAVFGSRIVRRGRTAEDAV